MARCGCTSECTCRVQGSDCVTVTGNGSVASPYTVGLSLAASEGTTPLGSNTFITCVDGVLTGFTGVYNVDTACIALDGEGTSVDPLNATPIFSADPGNMLECRPDGMYAPAGSAPVADDFALLSDGGTTPSILPAAGGGISTIPVQFDTDDGSSGINVWLTGSGPSHAFTYVEITAAGYYYVASSVQGWGAGGPTYAANMICRNSVYVDTGGGGTAYLQAAAPLVTTVAATGNAPMVSVTGILELGVGDEVWVQFSAEDWTGGAFPGATLTTTYPTSAFFHIMKVAV